MARNRLPLAPPEALRLPRPAAPPLNPANFQACPVAGACPQLAAWQQELYRWAYAQAQAVAAPSLPERDLLGVWN